MADDSAVKAKSKRGAIYWHYVCESAREIGILTLVFSVLDFRFAKNEVSEKELWAWMLSGVVMLGMGIFAAKETK